MHRELRGGGSFKENRTGPFVAVAVAVASERLGNYLRQLSDLVAVGMLG